MCNIDGFKFRLVTWHDEVKMMTAKEIFDRVSKDSESNYGWIASATQLYTVCHTEGFPEKYAVGIMLLILNCYANLELLKTVPSSHEALAQETVNSIYAELSSKDETIKSIKDKYLRNIIKGVIEYDTEEVRLKLDYGKHFYELEKNWEEDMFQKYSIYDELNFKKVRAELYREYDKFLKSARLDEKVKQEMEIEKKKREDAISEFIKNMTFFK